MEQSQIKMEPNQIKMALAGGMGFEAAGAAIVEWLKRFGGDVVDLSIIVGHSIEPVEKGDFSEVALRIAAIRRQVEGDLHRLGQLFDVAIYIAGIKDAAEAGGDA